MDQTERLVGECFTATFPQMDAESVRHANVDDIESWDSTRMLTLVAVVEEQFGLSIPEKDIFDLTSYDAVLDYVRKRQLYTI
jgi:acyl carrier protein